MSKKLDVELPVVIERQPDYTTCGPTALHAIYHYYGDPIALDTVIKETPKLPGGGTLGVHLSVHALRRGYDVTTWLCNVRHFDPTWFQQPTDVMAKLKARGKAKGLFDDPRYGPALESVEEYISLGGKLTWGDVTPELLGGRLARGTPLLTGTNGTYLYQCMRETAEGPDDVNGEAFGHFIVIAGFRSSDQTVAIADPLLDNPAHGTKYYRAGVHRLLAAIFLGVGSDDGNLVLIEPKGWSESPTAHRLKATARSARGRKAASKAKAKAKRGKPTGAAKRSAAKKSAAKKSAAKKSGAKKSRVGKQRAARKASVKRKAGTAKKKRAR